MTDTAPTTRQLDDPAVLGVDILLSIGITAASLMLRPSDGFALDAAVFLLMNLKPWTPR